MITIMQGSKVAQVSPTVFSSSPHYFIRGKEAAPLLLPLAGINGDINALVRFCRRICPGASILAFNFNRCSKPVHSELAPLDPVLADWLMEVLKATIRTYDISLKPIIVVGHAAGADLGTAFTLKYGLRLAAAILLRPGAGSKMMPVGILGELPILLGLLVSQEAEGTAGWQLKRVLQAAGAQLVCERVPNRQTPGGRETALARVFIGALFGNF